jgi:hypothetical protein
MKRTGITLRSILVLSCITLVMASCRKECKENVDADVDEVFNQAEFASEDADNLADAATVENTSSSSRMIEAQDTYMGLSACATITKDSTGGIFTRTVDFGTTNCLCTDNRYRRGKIIITHTGNRFMIGSTKTVTFDNYYVNDQHLEGTRVITNTGNLTWNIDATNMKLTKPDGSYITWTSNRTRTMTAGNATPHLFSDDIFSIIGVWNGTRSDGKTVAATITSPLKRAMNCKWIESGVIEKLVSGDNSPRVIDFGNGNCDDQATVSYRHRSKTITLR